MIRILLLGLVLAGVWYLYRMVTRQTGAEPSLSSRAEAAREAGGGAESTAESAAEQADEQEEMQECPVCRAYLPASATDGCGRPDCPIPALAAARESEPRGGTTA